MTGSQVKMPKLFMPDPDRLPEGLSLSPVLVQHYQSLPDLFVASWQSLGGGGDLSPPTFSAVSQVSGENSVNIPNYQRWAEELKSEFTTLAAVDKKISSVSSQSAVYCDEGRKDLAGTINVVSGLAATDPRDVNTVKNAMENGFLPPDLGSRGGEISEDDYVMAIFESASGLSSGVMQQINQKFQGLKKTVEKQQPTAPRQQLPSTPQVPTPTLPINPQQTSDTADYGSEPGPPPALDLSGSTADLPNTSSESPATTTDSATDGVSGQSASDPATASATSSPAQASSATSPYSPADFALPQAIQNYRNNLAEQQLAQAQAGESGLGSMPETPALISARQAAAPAAASPAATTPQPSNTGGQSGGSTGGQSGVSVPAADGAPPAASTSPAPNGQPQPGSAPPANATATPVAAVVPNDGSTVFTFPDGRSQRVSVVVANALTAAIGNAATTDGRAAYDGTPAQIPPGDHVGGPADPNQVVTGDLATWEGHRTALVAAFPADQGGVTGPGGSLEVIIEGQLHRVGSDLDQMSDKQGNFGKFAGFFHPAGIDVPDPGPAPDGQPANPDPSNFGQASVPA